MTSPVLVNDKLLNGRVNVTSVSGGLITGITLQPKNKNNFNSGLLTVTFSPAVETRFIDEAFGIGFSY